jgi:hypothetical protein
MIAYCFKKVGSHLDLLELNSYVESYWSKHLVKIANSYIFFKFFESQFEYLGVGSWSKLGSKNYFIRLEHRSHDILSFI